MVNRNTDRLNISRGFPSYGAIQNNFSGVWWSTGYDTGGQDGDAVTWMNGSSARIKKPRTEYEQALEFHKKMFRLTGVRIPEEIISRVKGERALRSIRK